MAETREMVQIEALENLSKLDATLSKLEAELVSEGEALSDKKEQLRRLEERFEITRATVGDMDRTRNELMQDARQMSVQMERSREKLEVTFGECILDVGDDPSVEASDTAQTSSSSGGGSGGKSKRADKDKDKDKDKSDESEDANQNHRSVLPPS